MRRRRILISLAAPLTLVALSGCIDVAGDVTVNPDATASGSISMSMERESAALFGIDNAQTLTEAFTSGEVMEEGLIPEENCIASDTEDTIAITCSFENTVFDKPGELWQISQTDQGIEMRIMNLAVNDIGMLPADIPVGELAITARFPGPITSIEGDFVTQVDDTTAVVNASLSDFVNVTITAESSSGAPWIAIVGGALLAALIVGLFLWIRARNARDTRNVITAELPAGEDAL